MRLVFMVEELSMKELLEIILPQILPSEVTPLVIPHQGKSDLRKSIPRKLNAWQSHDDKFVIVHDQDSHDCKKLKSDLRALCKNSRNTCLVRIACRELEAWYFGDLEAVGAAYGKKNFHSKHANKKKYRCPDAIGVPCDELHKLIPEYEQIAGAKRIGRQMNVGRNTSPSFQTFVSGVKQLLENTKVQHR